MFISRISSLALILIFLSCNRSPIFQVTDNGDTIAPIITITHPADQAVLSDTVTISAYAFDDRALKSVVVYLDSTPIITKNDTPFTLIYQWITNGTPEDTFRTIWAEAEDSAGNFNQTQPVRVLVDNEDNEIPSGSIIYPYTGQTIAGEINIIIEAIDNKKISFVNIYINGDSIIRITESPYIYNWDTRLEIDDNIYEIHAHVQDNSNNQITLGPIGVLIDNIDPIDITPPSGTIYNPASSSTVSGTVNIQISAYDDSNEHPLADIEINGNNLYSNLTYPYDSDWNTQNYEDGIHTINVRLTDGSGNSRMLYPVAVNVNNNGIPDETPPSVVIFSPAFEETVSGNVSIIARASDIFGINRVEFFIDYNLVGNQTSIDGDSYIYNWETEENFNDGQHVIYCIAYDNNENHTQSQPFTVYLDNIDSEPPYGYILSPSAGQTVDSTVSIQVVASDNIEVATVQVLINGAYVNEYAINQTNYFEYLWNTENEIDDEQYQIYALIQDAAGNSFNTSPIDVTVNNNSIPNEDFIPPFVSILNPIAFQTITDTVDIISFATDNLGISSLEILIDDELQATLTDTPYVYPWDTTLIPDSTNHTIRVIAHDIHGNQSTTQPILITVE